MKEKRALAPPAGHSTAPGSDRERFPPRLRTPRLLQTIRFGQDPFTFLAQTRARLGDAFFLDLVGIGSLLFVCSPELLHEIHRLSDQEALAGKIRNEQFGYLIGSKASINIDGTDSAERRRLLTPYFNSHGMLPRLATIRELTETTIARWPTGGTITLQPDLDRISLATISRILYGPLERKSTQRLMELSRSFLVAFSAPAIQFPFFRRNFGRWSPWARFVTARHELRQALGDEIDRRLEQDDTAGDDLLSGFMQDMNVGSEAEKKETLIDEVASQLVGGSDSVAKILSWMIIQTLEHPAALQRLRREIDETLGDRPVEASDLPNLPYLEAVTLEALRTQRVSPFGGPRQAQQTICIGGYTILKGTVMVQALREVGRSSLFPYPDRFEPENFYQRGIKMRDWLPFGGGKHACTGQGLALVELAVVLATIVQRVEIELGPGSIRQVRKGFTFQPANGGKVRILEKRALTHGVRSI